MRYLLLLCVLGCGPRPTPVRYEDDVYVVNQFYVSEPGKVIALKDGVYDVQIEGRVVSVPRADIVLVDELIDRE